MPRRFQHCLVLATPFHSPSEFSVEWRVSLRKKVLNAFAVKSHDSKFGRTPSD